MGKRTYGQYVVETSNEDKTLFPDAGITKGDLIYYYERIAERMLVYLEDRALVVQRFPDGIETEGFYQKQVGRHFPEWITRVRVDVGTSNGTQELAVCNNKATLVYLANQACITLHSWLSRTDEIDCPDLMVIDLDPPGDDFEQARVAALRVRDILEELDLPSYAKLTGSKGVHVVVPLDRSADFDTVRSFARSAMEVLASRHADELTTEQRKEKRRGRLYLDTGRNAYAQTAVAPYSVRPKPNAPIAMPVAYKDLEQRGIGPRDYTIENVFRRLSGRDDPWADLRRRARSLDSAREALQRMRENG